MTLKQKSDSRQEDSAIQAFPETHKLTLNHAIPNIQNQANKNHAEFQI